MFYDPQDTIRIVHALERRGMTDKHFREIHHLGDSIETHLKYCKTETKFFAGKNNASVQLRLQYVLNAIDELGLDINDDNTMLRLVRC